MVFDLLMGKPTDANLFFADAAPEVAPRGGQAGLPMLTHKVTGVRSPTYT